MKPGVSVGGDSPTSHLASWVWSSRLSRTRPILPQIPGQETPTSPCIFLLSGVTLRFRCLLHSPRGRFLANMLRLFPSLSPGLCGGCSLLFSEWGGKTSALWLLSSGGGACWGADRSVACWSHRCLFSRPGLCQILKATGGGQQKCQGLLMASTLCQNLSHFACNAAKASQLLSTDPVGRALTIRPTLVKKNRK